MISQESIERVKNEASILQIVSETVPLRRAGSNYTGLCPFHSERSPSFFVREDRNSYHCFGCGASGNVISFVMNTRALTFPDAVEMLAGRFGIELKYDSKGKGAPKVDRERLFSLCHTAQLFFRRSILQVRSAQGEYKKLGEYIKKRGLNADAINTFGIGYAPIQRGVLIETLKKAGFNEETILLSGLVRRAASGEMYELFRGRLLFPIFVDTKRISGFGGRLIPGVLEANYEQQSPKYVNSPETPIYQKSKTFYGLPQAMNAIRESGEVFVVEGYMDVVGLAMRGVRNVVACCGTALTEQHIKRLAGVCSRVHLLFDGDAAGQAAAAKSFAVGLNAEIDLKACFLPAGLDPDDFAKLNGERSAAALNQLPKGLLVDLFVDSVLAKHGCTDGQAPGPNLLGKVCEEVGRVLAGAQREVVLSSLITRVARRLKVETAQIEGVVKLHRTGGAGGNQRSQRFSALSDMRGAQSKVFLDNNGRGDLAQDGSNHTTDRGKVVLNRSPQELPKSDLALLRVVMVLREGIIELVLKDGDLCEMLQPESLGFLIALADILACGDPQGDLVKGAIKGYLQQLGRGWVALWREAHTIVPQSDEDPRAVFQKTLFGFRREKLMRLIQESQREIGEAADDPQRQAEAFERLRGLKGQLDKLSKGVDLAPLNG